MRILSSLLLGTAFIISGILSCGGGAGGAPPDVAGTYDCTAGCTGTCQSSATVTITQSGSDIQVVGNVPCDGTVQNDGSFDIDCQGSPCTGDFNNGTATVNCIENGVTCQTSTFTRR